MVSDEELVEAVNLAASNVGFAQEDVKAIDRQLALVAAKLKAVEEELGALRIEVEVAQVRAGPRTGFKYGEDLNRRLNENDRARIEATAEHASLAASKERRRSEADWYRERLNALMAEVDRRHKVAKEGALPRSTWT